MRNLRDVDNARKEELTRLVEQHQASLLALCYAFLHDRELARDAVQNTFLRAYQALGTFRGDSSMKTWLMSIAMNECRSLRRSAWFSRVKRTAQPVEPSAVQEDFDMDAADLSAAIQRLPEKLKTAVLLYYFQELTLQETAIIIGVTPSMVSRRIRKARAMLRDALGKEYLHG